MSNDNNANFELFRRTYEEALRDNEESIKSLEQWKKELEDVSLNLEENQKHFTRKIMVPLGSKALMRGKMVHTNEVFVNLGDRWFVKTSATRANEINRRRIQKVDEQLGEFRKETDLLTSNLEKPQELELYPNEEEFGEIFVPDDDEYEKEWNERHKERVREQKKQEAIERAKYLEESNSKIDNLDDYEDEEEDYSDDEEDEYSSTDEENDDIANDNVEKIGSVDEETTESVLSLSKDMGSSKKRVTFSSIDSINPAPDCNESAILINFQHSTNTKNTTHSQTDSISSPADIYQQYLMRPRRKSILKNENYVPSQPIPKIEDDSAVNHGQNYILSPKSRFILGDVIEKKSTSTNGEMQKSSGDADKRPMSLFQKRRMQV